MKKQLPFNKMRRSRFLGKYTFGLALAMTSFFSSAQTMVTVGTATTTTNNAPVNAANAFHYSQSIYKASDIIAAGGNGIGTITKVRYYYSSGGSANSTGWTVYLGHTNKVNFTSNTDWIPAAGLTNCFSGTVTFPATGNWLEITLTTPFQWNGVDNIVIGVDENQAGSAAASYWRYSSYGSDNRTIYYGNGTTNPDPMAPPTATSRGTWAPNVQLEWTTAPGCTGAPAHATAVANNTSICPGQAVNFSLTGGSFNTGFGYQWQYNTGSGWTDYASATNATFSTSPTQTVNVRAITTCLATSDRDTSEEASVAVNAVPNMTVNTPQIAFCSGDNVQLIVSDVSPTTTFAWAPAAGLNVTNNDTVSANPTNATTYTITGTNSFGCTATTTAFVSPLSKVNRTAAYTPNQICAPGSPVTVTTTVSPALINGGSTWEYQFLSSTGAVLQPWNATNIYNFVPGADSVYTIYYQVRSNSCPDQVDSLPLNVVVGFGADVAIVDYDCNNLGGIVTLSDIFEPTETLIYSNPFANATTDMTNVTLQGGAAITGGRMVITPSATSIGGASAIIQDPAIVLGANNSFIMKFKLTADQPINTWGTGGADGITYSFADDIANNANHNGSGSKLRLVFDAAGNNPNLVGIYLVYGNTGGVSSTAVFPTAPSTLYYSTNAAAWKLKTDVPVIFKIDIAGKASLSVDGVSIFSNIQMPAAYMNANTSTWKHAFSAATGGDAMRQAISNWQISSSQCKFALTPQGVTPSAWGNDVSFTGIQPGTYDVWMSNNGSASCSKKIETVEIVNVNPSVQLGNDTTICVGESVILDAGNPGATYTWSGSLETTQTRTVTQTGSYVVYVTNADGCTGIGSVNVTVNNIPTANSALFVQNNMPTYTFTVLNPQNVDSYSWNFGDGTTIANAPSTMSHTYTAAGPYMVTATLTNECGTQTVIQTIVVTSTAGIEENGIEGLSVYPNPASDKVIISLPETADASATVYSTTGTMVANLEKLDAQTEVSVQGWTPGVYFVRVQNESKTSTIKLVIQ